MKKNQKKFLALLMALLMVTFLISPSAMNGGGTRSKGQPIGKIGKTTLYAIDRRQASDEWTMLGKSIDMTSSQMQRRFVSPLEALGQTIFYQVQDHPELYLLLIREAEMRGIGVGQDVLGSVMQNQIRSRAYSVSDRAYQEAVRHYLMVKMLRDQLIGDVKYSDPMWKRELADTANQAALNLVEFNAEQLKILTTAPTTQQVEKLFDDYRHVQPRNAATLPSDALGFAYEIPNRVKLQYLQITRKQAFEAAKAAKNAYDTDVEAREYYLRNQTNFVRMAPATVPAAMPATQSASSTQPATAQSTTAAAVASTQPSTRPYAEVKDEILETLIGPQAEKLQAQVAQALHDRLLADYANYRLFGSTTAPSTKPTATTAASATTQPAPYDSYAYLESVALDMQRQFNILPQVRQIAEWQDADQLAKEPGIGAAEVDSHKFPQLATQDAAPFASGSVGVSGALQIWQPSDVLTDSEHSSYEFRLTDASPAHAANFADVRARVESDALLKAAYDSAEAAAAKFADAARKGSFTRAAFDDRRVMTSTGSFEPRQILERSGMIPNFLASKEATTVLALKAQDLLTEASAADPHPIAVVPLPAERKVIVVQLADVTMQGTEPTFYFQKMGAAQQFEMRDSEGLAAKYFDYSAVCTRLDFHPDDSAKSPGS
jgi:hypothetical protein